MTGDNSANSTCIRTTGIEHSKDHENDVNGFDVVCEHRTFDMLGQSLLSSRINYWMKVAYDRNEKAVS